MGAIPTLTGTGYLFPLQTGNSGKFLTTDGSTLSWGTPSGGGGITGSGTTNYIPKWTSGSALGNSLVFDDGTNVGIGTATPGHKLDVSGLIRAYANATYNGENGAIIASNATNLNKRVFIGYDGTIDAGFIQSVFSGTSYKPLLLNPTSGNVIIGSTSDSGDKLQVNGAIKTAPPTGYTAKPWKLGDATSGTITPDYYIKVEIDGQIYSIPALLGVP